MRMYFTFPLFMSFCLCIYSQQKKEVRPFHVKNDTLIENRLLLDSKQLNEINIEEFTEPPIFISTEILPQFVGGDSVMEVFFNKNIRYPRTVTKGEVQGFVIARFVVLKDGKIDPQNIKIVTSLSYDCDSEVVRLLHKMPRWIPGRQGGFPVPFYQTIGVYLGKKKLKTVRRLLPGESNMDECKWNSYHEIIEKRY
ncbi:MULTISPECIES: energy transducer TonB [Dysgonomonas]|uniref:TonB C-terminal domain-containing protein n=1 Tax=Dysgonomonas gadei ATCC BAA-286 TaxID=742766 RepID=F5ISZ7_9BACT|nr:MULTISPECIES: energy transducer TonB [Dysgonomonas]EGK01174.1 hypothetical protein HMPREF9455_00214 [Dysgonomonas gadei ATCC BAA-286]MBF0647758.1 energy transducer TonB [Dysgonomonas sp. GY75]